MTAARRASTLAVVLLTIGAGTRSAGAQACHGFPRGGGLAAEYGTLAIGHTYGFAAGLTGGPLAIAATVRSRDISADVAGFEGLARLSLVGRAGPISICPGLGAGYQREEWEPERIEPVVSRTLSWRGGVSAGLEQRVYGGFIIAPFVGVHYQFEGSVVEVSAPGNFAGGDSLSHVDIEYGLIGRYGAIFAGFSASRFSDGGDRPYIARWLLGVAFGSAARSRTEPVRRQQGP